MNTQIQSQTGNPYLEQLATVSVTKPPAIKIVQGQSAIVVDKGVRPGSIYRTDTKAPIVGVGEPFYFVPLYITSNIEVEVYDGNVLNYDALALRGVKKKYEVIPFIQGAQGNSHLIQRKKEFFDINMFPNHNYSGKTVFYKKQMVVLAYPYIGTLMVQPPFQIPIHGVGLIFANKLVDSIKNHILSDPSKNSPFDNIYVTKTVPETAQGHSFFAYEEAKIHGAIDPSLHAQLKKDWNLADTFVKERKLVFESNGEQESTTEIMDPKRGFVPLPQAPVGVPVPQVPVPVGVPFPQAPVPVGVPAPFPVPVPQAPVPFPQAPVPFPQAPVPFPQAPVPFPQAPVPAPLAPIPQVAQAPFVAEVPRSVGEQIHYPPSKPAQMGVPAPAPAPAIYTGAPASQVPVTAPPRKRRKRKTKAELEAEASQRAAQAPTGVAVAQDIQLDGQQTDVQIGTVKYDPNSANAGGIDAMQTTMQDL